MLFIKKRQQVIVTMKKGVAIGIGVAITVAAISIAVGVVSTSPDTAITESLTDTPEKAETSEEALSPSEGRVFEVRLSDGVGVEDIP